MEVADIKSVDDFRPAMEASGYQVMGEYGIPGRRFFRKRDHAGVRTHHVHAFASGSPEINRHLAFRDFMIAHPEWAARYSDLKRNLAETCSGNIERYMDGKDALIQEVDARAAASS